MYKSHGRCILRTMRHHDDGRVADIDQRCWIVARAANSTIARTCICYEAWPIPSQATQRFLSFGGHAWLAWEESGRVFARRMVDGALSDPLDLGPGTFDEVFSEKGFLWPAWGGLLPLNDAFTAARQQQHRFLELGLEVT